MKCDVTFYTADLVGQVIWPGVSLSLVDTFFPALIISVTQKSSFDLGFYGFATLTMQRI